MTPQATEDGLILLEFLRANWTLRDQLRFLLLQSSVLLLQLANHGIRDQVNKLAESFLSRNINKEGIKSNIDF